MTTPLPTKAALAATLGCAIAATAAYFMSGTGTAGAYLCLFSGLFLVRVAGQVLVRVRRPAWLPPTDEWNLTPYALLLPAQLVILALMAWIDVDVARDAGFWAEPRRSLGVGVIVFALVYAGAMLVRYVVRMARRPEQRWFGGTIPIVFHWVLAAYLLVFGSFHVSA
jgi:hypothetical protein